MINADNFYTVKEGTLLESEKGGYYLVVTQDESFHTEGWVADIFSGKLTFIGMLGECKPVTWTEVMW